MRRIIETYGQNGVIEITGNPQETVLFLKDKPIQYSWIAEVGSTWRYHIAQGLDNPIVKVHDEIVEMLKRGINNEGDFLVIAEYFIQFFKYGKYEFGHYELFEDISWIEIPQNENYSSFDYYGGSFHMTPTQNNIDKKLVEEYKEYILKGFRPTMVILHVENSHKFFILDGHHKFLAYKKAKIKAQSMIITKLGNEYKSINQTIKLAKRMDCMNQDYLKWMKSEKSNIDVYKTIKLLVNEIFEEVKY